eukprot:2572846-Prymnesium_polylepis.1
MACVINAAEGLTCVGRPEFGVLRSKDWKNVSAYSAWDPDPADPMIGEDPMVWIDRRGLLHVVTHGGGWDSPFGYHYWTTREDLDEGKPFHANNKIKAYQNVVEVVDAADRKYSRRERPHVVLGRDGTPIALTAGVTAAWPCDWPSDCPTDYCYTFAQPLNDWVAHI